MGVLITRALLFNARIGAPEFGNSHIPYTSQGLFGAWLDLTVVCMKQTHTHTDVSLYMYIYIVYTYKHVNEDLSRCIEG